MTVFVLACLGLFPVTAGRSESAGFTSGKAHFSVRCNHLLFGYAVQSLFLLPGERLRIDVLDADWNQPYELQTDAGPFRAVTDRRWEGNAPLQPGFHEVTIRQVRTNRLLKINLVVMVPFQALRGEWLNGYRIGRHPKPRVIRSAAYAPPRGFIEIHETDLDRKLTPHFTIEQFLCKQPGGYPKYLVLDERLLIKLEVLLEKLDQEGYPGAAFRILSGYRTPYYNRYLGNVPYSSHVWGRAADIYIDRNGDGLMDDLNHDGHIDRRDTHVLYRVIDRMDREYRYQNLIGGLGLYERTGSHGPFVHFDVRGVRARWGLLPSAEDLAELQNDKDAM